MAPRIPALAALLLVGAAQALDEVSMLQVPDVYDYSGAPVQTNLLANLHKQLRKEIKQEIRSQLEAMHTGHSQASMLQSGLGVGLDSGNVSVIEKNLVKRLHAQLRREMKKEVHDQLQAVTQHSLFVAPAKKEQYDLSDCGYSECPSKALSLQGHCVACEDVHDDTVLLPSPDIFKATLKHRDFARAPVIWGLDKEGTLKARVQRKGARVCLRCPKSDLDTAALGCLMCQDTGDEQPAPPSDEILEEAMTNSVNALFEKSIFWVQDMEGEWHWSKDFEAAQENILG